MRPMLRPLLACACLTLALGVHAAEFAPFTAVYTLAKGSWTVGVDRVSLQQAGNDVYRYESKSHATGLVGEFINDQIDESSLWREQGNGIRPLEYRYSHRGGRHDREVALRFDWSRGRVVNTINRDPWTMKIEPGTLDKLVVQLALMRDLRLGRRTMEYPVADGGTLKTYRFQVVGHGTLKTRVGVQEIVRVREVRAPLKRHMEFWCAPKLGYLPVQVIQYRDGEEQLRMTLESLKPSTGPAASSDDAPR